MNALETLRAARALLASHLTPQFGSADERLPAISRRTPGLPPPLSFCQEQLWLHAQLAPDIPAYNESFMISRQGPLDVPALEKSLSEIMKRHEAWRTEFTIENGQPVQVIQAASNISIPLVDLRGVPRPEQESETLRLAGEDARRPFNLSRGPLSRIKLVRLGDSEHRLLLTVHHIVSDTASIYSVFLPELVALYEAFATGKSSPLPELSIQYADFAHWQREQWQAGSWAEQMAYWKRQLSGEIPALQLPTDRPRPSVQNFRGDSQTFTISKSLTERLKAAGAREDTTLFATFFAVFSVLLYRYTQQEDMVLGSVTTGRSRPELQGLLGYFLNPIVLRTDLSGDPTFQEVLRRTHEVISTSWANGQVPFELLVNELRPERRAGSNPFFQVMFSLEPTLPDFPAGWDLTQLSVKSGGSKFDLYLETEERPEGVIGRFTYNSDLFEPDTIARMSEHFQVLIEGVAVDTERRLSELPILTAAERKQFLVDWNNTTEDYPRDLCVHQLIEAQAARTPGALAVAFESQALTYGQLNERANQLASHLRKLGVGPDVLVGICAERSLEMMIGLLGILKAGGAYLPLDPTYPEERLAFMMQDAGVGVLLTQEVLKRALPTTTARIIRLDADWDAISEQAKQNPRNVATPASLAYVIYTSGSTGKPKGVQIPHCAVVNFLTSMAKSPGIASHDRLLAVTTLSFDIAGLELLLPLTVGASVEITSPEVSSDGRQLAEKLVASGVTIMQATPATWRMLLEAGWQGDSRIKILCGGEALSRELANQLLKRSASLWNMYGPTETTIWSLIYRIRSEHGRVLLGRPIANTQLYILDRNLNLVPVGVPGELHIGGDGLARGYLHRPELTAEKFIPHPFSQDPEARLYKTGDLARCLRCGDIDFLGRIDHQVKIRGFRIELGEIEAALAEHPQVKDVAVVACEDASGGKSLVAYVVPGAGQSPTTDELRRTLKRKLPAYMLPSRFVFLHALPLMPNGKIDRNSLALSTPFKSKAGNTCMGARSPLEGQILHIWEELLEARPIGVQDDFFELGGNSLLAVRLMYRIEQACGKRLPLATLFAGATVEYLATALLNAGQERLRRPLVEVQAGGANPPFFFCHGGYGGGSYCRRLAQQLGKEQPFWAIAPNGLEGELIPTTIEGMAAERLGTLLDRRPNGPYLLGGYCNGGLVAFEMARQMGKMGLKVDLLVVVEASATNVRFRWLRRSLGLLGFLLGRDREAQFTWFVRFRDFFTVYSQLSEKGKLTQLLFVLNKIKAIGHRVVAPKMGQPGIESASGSSPQPDERLLACARAINRAMEGYVPEPYQGRIVLLRTDSMQSVAPCDPTAGWGRVAKEVEVLSMPGTHDACVTENLGILAEHLAACLRKASQPVTANGQQPDNAPPH